MPKRCFGCPMVSFIGTCNVNKNYLIKPLDGEGKDPDCPVVKIPTPHGRLIDADEIRTSIEAMKAIESAMPEHTQQQIFDLIINLISNVDTVIEAEE